MNVLLVTQNYAPFIGGIEAHVRQVARELSRPGSGHRAAVAAMNFTACKLPARLRVLHTSLLAPRYSDYDDGPVPVHSLSPTPLERARMLPIALRATPVLQRHAYHALNRLAYRAYQPVVMPRLLKLMGGVDVVHSLAGGHLAWAALAAARAAGLPFACTPFVHPHQWGDGPEDVDFYRRCDAVIGLVDTDRDYLASIGVPPEKLHVIGVSPELPAASDGDGFRRRHGLGAAPIVLYVGRMMPEKGAAAVLACAPAVWRNHPDARFLFIGPATPEQARQFDAADPRVAYLGKVDAQEKADALAACDVFCMPSMSEILPTVYLEAWSLGKPVIGGKAHGLTELVEGNRAGLNAGQDPAEVAHAVGRLLDDAGLRHQSGAAGKALVQQRYAVPAVTASLLRLYGGLIAARAATVPHSRHTPTPAEVA